MEIRKKIWPEYFNSVASGKKKFELRLNDFEACEGDTLILEEWDPKTHAYTGRRVEKIVSNVLKFSPLNLPFWPKEDMERHGLQIISLEDIPRATASLDDFKKLNLRVGRITHTEAVEGSEKLLKFTVDIGTEKRQILAGIAKAYAPEKLIGREIIIIANLEPRSLMGLESQGMLLAADDNGTPILLQPERDVPPGSSVR